MSDQYGGYRAAGTQQGGTFAPFEPFLATFAPAGAQPPTDAFVEYARTRVPAELVDLWRSSGIGFYGYQRLAVVDPSVWLEPLAVWLGPNTTSIPIVVTSFGHLYHWDQATHTVQCLDPHFQTNTVIARDLPTFFNEHLPGPESHIADLEGPFNGAYSKLGPLQGNEIYYFDPILALGGRVAPEALRKGDGPRHLADIHAALRQN